MKWRCLAIIGMSVYLGGCFGHQEFPPCPPPGAVGAKTCYYRLNIVAKLPNKDKDGSSMVTGMVAKSVIEENRKRRSELGWFEFTDYQLDEYPFFTYTFPVEDSTFAELIPGEDVEFVSTPNKPVLKKRPKDSPSIAR